MYIDYDGKRERYIEAMVRRVTANIRNYRANAGFTQAGLAERAGFSTKHIGNIEKGNVNFSLETLFGCAFAFEVPVEDMFREPASVLENIRTGQSGDPMDSGITYEVVSGKIIAENGKNLESFGIAGYRLVDGVRTLVRAIYDISTSRKRVEGLTNEINSAGLAPAHLMDIIEDFLQ